MMQKSCKYFWWYYNTKRFFKNASVSISKKIFNKLQLNTALSYSERTPTATEMYGFYLFNASDGYDYIGKTNLLSEKSLQFDLSTLYKWKQNKIQINYYFSKVNNFIVGKINSLFSSMTIGANGVKNFSNISFAKIWGLEATSFVNLSPKFITVSTFRYTNAKDNNNMHLPFVSPLKILLLYDISQIIFCTTRNRNCSFAKHH